MRKIFITGTDTDCGKTYVSTQLIRILNQEGAKAIGLKPVASGVNLGDSTSDIALLTEANNTSQQINLFNFREPIAPHIAAEKEGKVLCAQSIVDFCTSKDLSKFDTVCIEGAGGIMMPLNLKETWVDVIKTLGAEVILVVGMRLGCINHALLSYQCLRQNGIACLGWIANILDPRMNALVENIDTLRKVLNIPCLSVVPLNGHLDTTILKSFWCK